MTSRSMPSNPRSLWSLAPGRGSLRALGGGLLGLGFLIIVVSYLSAAAFLWIGAQTPRLDEAFVTLQKRTLAGFDKFTEPEIRLLSAVLADHPGFFQALVGRGSVGFLEPTDDGWLRTTDAHLVVRSAGSQTAYVEVGSYGSPRDYPITITVSGNGIRRTLKLASKESGRLEFGPSELPRAGILSFKVSLAVRGRQSDSWGVRVIAADADNREAP